MSKRKTGAMLGYVYLLLRNGTSFFLTPFMLTVWDKSQYGLYQLSMTLAAYFTLIDLGVQNSIIKYVSQYRSENDKQKENLFAGTVFSFYCIVSILIIVVGFIVKDNLSGIFHRSMTPSEISTTGNIFLVLMVNAILNLFFNVFVGVSTAYERFSTLRLRDILKTVFRFIAIIIMLNLKMSPLSIVFADLIVNVIFNISIVWLVLFDIKTRPTLKGGSLKYFGSILNYSVFVYVNVLAVQLFWMVDNVILGIITSTAVIAVYSLGTLINSYFQSFSAVIANVLMPGVVNLVTKGSSSEHLLNESVRIGRVKLLFFSWLAIGFAFLGKKFIYLWAGPDYVLAYSVAIIIILPQLITYTQDVLANIMWAREKHKMFAVIMLVVSLLNVGITLFLVKRIGMIGAAYATCFAFIVGFVIFASIYYHTKLNINMYAFYIKVFRGILPASLISCAIAYAVSLWAVNSWVILIVQGLVITLFYGCFSWYIGMNNYEKNLIKSLIRIK